MNWQCKKGHEYTPETVSFSKKGHRVCLICRRIKDHKKRERQAWAKLKSLSGDITPRRPAEVHTSSDVIAAVAYDFGLPASALKADIRFKPFMLARRTAAYTLVRRGNSTPRAGKWLGVDHSTVVHAIQQFEASATEEMRAVAERYILRGQAA